MSAILIYYQKAEEDDRHIVEMAIWKIPVSTERPHGLKYRLHYGTTDGVCCVRYDNEKRKGDHKHIGNKEEVYRFESAEKLIRDFLTDVAIYKQRQAK